MIVSDIPLFAIDQTLTCGGNIKYIVHDEFAETANIQYIGYLAADGKWIIMKIDRSGDTFTYRFACGKSGYAAALTNKASLTYGLLTEMGA